MKNTYRTSIIFIVPGLLAGAALFYLMQYGPGVSPDSVTYLQTAKSLLAGQGYMTYGNPMTHFPPLYSTMLALGGLIPIKLISVSRLVQSAIFALNLIVFCYAVWIASSRNFFAASAAGLLFITAMNIVRIHSYVWSEGLFFFLGMSGYILLAYYLENNRRWLLFIASALVGLAILTRYAGLAFLPPVLLLILFRRGYSLRHKLPELGMALLIAILPVAIWMLRNMLIADTATNRTLVFHMIKKSRMVQFSQTVTQFFVPWKIPSLNPTLFVYLFSFVILILVIFVVHKHGKVQSQNAAGYYLVLLNLIFAAAYLAFVIFSASFLDAAIPMDARMIFPFNTVLLMVLISGLFYLISSQPKFFSVSALVVVIILAGFQGKHTLVFTNNMFKNGLEYQSYRWRSSETISYLQKLPDDITVYVNARDALVHRINLNTQPIPRKYNPYSLQRNVDFSEQFDSFCKQLNQEGTLLLYFTNVGRDYLPSFKETEAHCNILPTVVLNDGRIYITGYTGPLPEIMSINEIEDD
jgi:4-amino-4-deoxy-L-arabinose transferase-like glycosyltransferase